MASALAAPYFPVLTSTTRTKPRGYVVRVVGCFLYICFASTGILFSLVQEKDLVGKVEADLVALVKKDVRAVLCL